jgi:hypothetical protein
MSRGTDRGSKVVSQNALDHGAHLGREVRKGATETKKQQRKRGGQPGRSQGLLTQPFSGKHVGPLDHEH